MNNSISIKKCTNKSKVILHKSVQAVKYVLNGYQHFNYVKLKNF